MESVVRGAAEHRKTRLKLAVATSIGSKVISILLQVIAYPIALKALGVERFGVYTVVAASMNWITMANIGIGPGLTLGIASAVAKGDKQEEQRYFSTAFFLISIIAAVLALGVTAVISFVPVVTLLGAQYAPYAGEIRQALHALDVILIGQLIFSVIESALAGYQEHYLINAWGIVGNILSAVCLLLTAFFYPSIVGMALSAYGCPVLARVLNGVWLLAVRRPYLRPRRQFFDRVIMKTLLHTGLGFAVTQLATFINHSFSIVLVGKFVGPKAAAAYAVLMQAVILAFGMISMHAQPLWPAVADAVARHETHWIERLYRKVVTFSMLYALCVGIVFAVAGKQIVKIWLHNQVGVLPTLPLQIATGVYFVLVVWEHLHYMLLIGMKQVWTAAWQMLLRAVILLALIPLFAPIFGRGSAMVGLCIATALTSAWMMVRSFRETLVHAEKISAELSVA